MCLDSFCGVLGCFKGLMWHHWFVQDPSSICLGLFAVVFVSQVWRCLTAGLGICVVAFKCFNRSIIHFCFSFCSGVWLFKVLFGFGFCKLPIFAARTGVVLCVGCVRGSVNILFMFV